MDQTVLHTDFEALLGQARTTATLPEATQETIPATAVEVLADHLRRDPALLDRGIRRAVEEAIGRIDALLGDQLNAILHAPDYQAMEAAWRGLHMLVRSADKDLGVKVRVLTLTKRELARTLRKYRGGAWDQSPLFTRLYEEEFGQLGGEPYGVLLADYEFDQRPDDVQLLSDLAMIAAAAHAPLLGNAAPSLLQMDSWAEIANPATCRAS